jgi:hypothetical protein
MPENVTETVTLDMPVVSVRRNWPRIGKGTSTDPVKQYDGSEDIEFEVEKDGSLDIWIENNAGYKDDSTAASISLPPEQARDIITELAKRYFGLTDEELSR